MTAPRPLSKNPSDTGRTAAICTNQTANQVRTTVQRTLAQDMPNKGRTANICKKPVQGGSLTAPAPNETAAQAERNRTGRTRPPLRPPGPNGAGRARDQREDRSEGDRDRRAAEQDGRPDRMAGAARAPG
jgi:hypothetical protein